MAQCIEPVAKCLGIPLVIGAPVCMVCNGTGVCHECKGEGGWVVELEVMRTEKKKVVLDGLDKIQEQLVTVYIPENKTCPLCGSHSTKTLELQATSSATYGNVPRYPHEVEKTTHLGMESGVHRDYMGNVVEDVRREVWKGHGKCRPCHGTGKAPVTSPSRSPPRAKAMYTASLQA